MFSIISGKVGGTEQTGCVLKAMENPLDKIDIVVVAKLGR